MALTELKVIPEPGGNQPIKNNELLVRGTTFDDFYSGDGELILSVTLTESIQRRFPDDAPQVLDIVLAVSRRQSHPVAFRPIADGKKQVIITQSVHGNGGSIYLAVEPLF